MKCSKCGGKREKINNAIDECINCGATYKRIIDYVQIDHGLNFNTKQSLKTGNANFFDYKTMSMSDNKIDNENGIVFAALWKLIDKSESGLISSLSEICYNPETGYYSRFNPIKYNPKDHGNHISLDNLIGHVYCGGRFAAKRINKKLNFPFYYYDDINYDGVISRSFLLRPDVIYTIKNAAGDHSCWLFFIPFLILRALSTIREKVTRPTIYQFVKAHAKKWLGMEYECIDTKWNRYQGWSTSGKAITMIMMESTYTPKWYKRWTLKKIGSMSDFYKLYFSKHHPENLRALVELAS